MIGCGANIATPTSSCQGGFRGALIGLFLLGGVAAYRDLALLLAVALVYIVLASQYRSLLHLFITMFSVPVGVIGVIWALLLTGTTLSVISFIAAIGGLAVSTLLTLVFIPVLYALFEDRRARPAS